MTTERPLLQREAEFHPADVSALEPVHSELGRFWDDVKSMLVPSVPDRWKMEFDTALSEVCANIIKHAFVGFSQPGTMILHLSLYKDRVEAHFTDDGALFNEESGTETLTLGPFADLPESGRGLQVARALLDTLHYQRSQGSNNNWLLVKILPK